MPVQIENQPQSVTDRRAQLLTESAREHHVSILHYVHGMTKQWQDAENIVQELWRYVLIYFPEHNIKRRGVLFDKARKLVIDHYRTTERKPAMGAAELEDHHMAKQSREAHSTAEEARLKNSFFAEYPDLPLTDSQKNVLWLHARYGFTYHEINSMTGHSVSTIGDWIVLGRKRMAAYINEEGA